MRPILLLAPLLPVLLLPACAAYPPPPPPGPLTLAAWVVASGWHTDVCVTNADADAWARELAGAAADTRYLCFGFGDKHYAAEHDHSLLTMAASLIPGDAVIMTTALRGPPETGLDVTEVVKLRISEAGLAGLAGFLAFLRRSSQEPGAPHPRLIADGGPQGGRYLAATDSYHAFETCNTWTAVALYAAGLPMRTGVLFEDDVMRQVRALAATQQAMGG